MSFWESSYLGPFVPGPVIVARGIETDPKTMTFPLMGSCQLAVCPDNIPGVALPVLVHPMVENNLSSKGVEIEYTYSDSFRYMQTNYQEIQQGLLISLIRPCILPEHSVVSAFIQSLFGKAFIRPPFTTEHPTVQLGGIEMFAALPGSAIIPVTDVDFLYRSVGSIGGPKGEAIGEAISKANTRLGGKYTTSPGLHLLQIACLQDGKDRRYVAWGYNSTTNW